MEHNRNKAPITVNRIKGAYYVWQMNDGRWHISPLNNHRLTRLQVLRLGDLHGHETEIAARESLNTLAQQARA